MMISYSFWEDSRKAYKRHCTIMVLHRQKIKVNERKMSRKRLNILKQNRGMSTVIAVVAIIIALVIGLVGGYFLAPTKTNTTTTTVTKAKLSGALNIGVAIPLTGDLGTYGANAKAALNLAS